MPPALPVTTRRGSRRRRLAQLGRWRWLCPPQGPVPPFPALSRAPAGRPVRCRRSILPREPPLVRARSGDAGPAEPPVPPGRSPLRAGEEGRGDGAAPGSAVPPSRARRFPYSQLSPFDGTWGEGEAKPLASLQPRLRCGAAFPWPFLGISNALGPFFGRGAVRAGLFHWGGTGEQGNHHNGNNKNEEAA